MKRKLLDSILYIVAGATTLAVVIPSGLHYCYSNICGVMFWGAHEHDGVWHLAVSRTLFRHFPYQLPNMSETMLHGYNYLLDWMIACVSLVTRIPDSIIYFQIIPIVWFVVFVSALGKFAKVYSETKWYKYFLIFFALFGSSFSYLATIRNNYTIWGSSGIMAMQALQNLINIQFALSLIPLLYILTGIAKSKRETRDYLVYGVLIFVTMGLKLYTGVGAALLIAFDYLVQSIRGRFLNLNQLRRSLIPLIFFVAAILVFYHPQTGTGSPLIFKPLATVNPIVEDHTLWYLPVTAGRLYSLKGPKLWLLETGILLLFLVLNFGTRLLALVGLCIKKNNENREIKAVIYLTATAVTLISILFVQKGVWWNTVQFLYVGLFLIGIISAEGLARLFSERKYMIGGVIVIAMTIPSNLDIIRSFTHYPGTSYIPDYEIQALSFLSNQPKGVVLSQYLQPVGAKDTIPALHQIYDTSYVAAYSSQQTYLNDTIQLELTNVDYQDRQDKVNGFDCEVLTEVNYVYELKKYPYTNRYESCGSELKKIYENDQVAVYKTN